MSELFIEYLAHNVFSCISHCFHVGMGWMKTSWDSILLLVTLTVPNPHQFFSRKGFLFYSISIAYMRWKMHHHHFAQIVFCENAGNVSMYWQIPTQFMPASFTHNSLFREDTSPSGHTVEWNPWSQSKLYHTTK